MKTLFATKKLYEEQPLQEKDSKVIRQEFPQKKQSRITSAYLGQKIIKGLPVMMPQQWRPPTAVQSQPFFQHSYQPIQQVIIPEAERQQSKETQNDPTPEIPIEQPKRSVRDLKQLVGQYPERRFEEIIISHRHPEYLDRGESNSQVHKHLSRLKSSKLVQYSQLPRNQSSKLERQRELIEKALQQRPTQSQQIKRRPPTNNTHSRPKTSVQSSKQIKSALTDQWFMLAQKAQEQAHEEVREKSVSHLDLDTNAMTQKEWDYIRKKKNFFLDDIRPYIQAVQLKEEQKQAQLKQEVLLSKFDQFNSLLSGPDEPLNETYDLDDEIHLKNEPLGEVNGFFHKADPINEYLQDNLKEVQDKFEKFNEQDQNLYKQQVARELGKPKEYLKIGEFLSNDELEIVIREIQRPVDERDYALLETLVHKLKFFLQFTSTTVILLLKLSSIRKYEYGQYVFNEGDHGDNMFIILKGACHVRIRSPHDKNDPYGPVLATLYDGQQFGELALIDPKKNKTVAVPQKYTLKRIRDEMAAEIAEKERAKNWWKKDYKEPEKPEPELISPVRSASIEAAQTTWVLSISREYFQSIILNVIQKELEDKLRVLSVMSCFDQLSQMELIPIANLLESETFKLGHIILKEQEPQKYFYIVARGRCKLVKEEVFIRDLKHLGEQISYKPFKNGLTDYQPKPDTKHRVKHFEVDLKDQIPNNQSHQYQEVFQNKEYKAFKYHFHYNDFVRGDFFMGRTLMNEFKSFDEHMDERNLSEPPRLSVISDSAETEVYKLNKSLFHLIPMPLKISLIEGIKQKQEFDAMYDYEEQQRTKQWDTYKAGVFRDVLRQKGKWD